MSGFFRKSRKGFDKALIKEFGELKDDGSEEYKKIVRELRSLTWKLTKNPFNTKVRSDIIEQLEIAYEKGFIKKERLERVKNSLGGWKVIW